MHKYDNTVISAFGLRYAMVFYQLEEAAKRGEYFQYFWHWELDDEIVRILIEQQFNLHSADDHGHHYKVDLDNYRQCSNEIRVDWWSQPLHT